MSAIPKPKDVGFDIRQYGVRHGVDISELTGRRRAQLRRLRSQTRRPEPWRDNPIVPGAESQSPCDTPPVDSCPRTDDIDNTVLATCRIAFFFDSDTSHSIFIRRVA